MIISLPNVKLVSGCTSNGDGVTRVKFIIHLFPQSIFVGQEENHVLSICHASSCLSQCVKVSAFATWSKYKTGTWYHTGKPNSPFSAKHHPFQAQTTRSPHTIPVLGLILPFTAQSHPPFSVFLTGPPHVLLTARYNCSRGHQSGYGEIYQIES